MFIDRRNRRVAAVARAKDDLAGLARQGIVQRRADPDEKLPLVVVEESREERRPQPAIELIAEVGAPPAIEKHLHGMPFKSIISAAPRIGAPWLRSILCTRSMSSAATITCKEKVFAN